MVGDTENLLLSWGVWCMQSSGSCRGYASPMAAVMALKAPGSGFGPAMGDEPAMRVDRAVARLKMRSSELYAVLYLRFVSRLGVAMIAKQVGEPRHVVERRLAGAVAWVDSAMAAGD